MHFCGACMFAALFEEIEGFFGVICYLRSVISVRVMLSK